jgi:hypothetical protein
MSDTLTLTAAVSPTSIRMSIFRAKSAIYYLEVERADGSPFDLSGSVIYYHASNGDFTLDKFSPSDGIVVTNAAEGLATLTIDPADTESLGAAGVFGMPCEFTLTGGSPAGTLELASGNLTVSPSVGTP